MFVSGSVEVVCGEVEWGKRWARNVLVVNTASLQNTDIMDF